jgi:outer membrane protein OmpA-like peptidoglycan-associated protein
MDDMEAMSREASNQEGGEFWISVSDLMSGLMVVFMFIAVAYVTNVAVKYEDLQSQLYKDLSDEFESDLDKWGAELDSSSLAVRFKEPDVLFDQGQDGLKLRFRRILGEFFPRYIDVLRRKKYEGDIEEVRIEGHTSSEWGKGVDGLDAYVANMELSQDRTRKVLKFVMDLGRVRPDTTWLIEHLTANGLSSSHVVVDQQGNEDKQRSRRVEFKVRTDAEGRIRSILTDEQQ